MCFTLIHIIWERATVQAVYPHGYCTGCVPSWLLYRLCILMATVQAVYPHGYCTGCVPSWAVYPHGYCMYRLLYPHGYCTGCVPSWLLHVQAVYPHVYCTGCIPSWLLYRLCTLMATVQAVYPRGLFCPCVGVCYECRVVQALGCKFVVTFSAHDCS